MRLLSLEKNAHIRRLVNLEFALNHYVDDLEIRIHVSSDTDMRLDTIVVEEQTSHTIQLYIGNHEKIVPSGVHPKQDSINSLLHH